MNGATPTQKETVELLDEYLLKLLREGGKKVVTSYNEDGSANVDTVALSAAELNVIRSRVKDLKVESAPGTGTASDSLREQAALRFKGRPMPPLSDGKDAATG